MRRFAALLMMRSGRPAHDSASASRELAVPLGWAVAVAAYATLIYSELVTGRGAVWLTDLAWTAASLIAAIATWRTSRRLAGERRAAWTLFAVAGFAWLFGQLIWDWNELIRHVEVPFPSAGDVGYIGFGLLIIVGLFYLRASQTARRLNVQRVANLGLIVCSLLIVLSTTLLEPALNTSQSGSFVALALIEALSFTAAFLAAMYFIWSYRWSADLLPLVLVTVGLAIHATAGLVYANNLLVDRYGASSLVNVAWLVAFGFQHWAARQEALAERRRRAHAILRSEGHGWVEALVPAFLLLFIAAARVAFVDVMSARTAILNAGLLTVFAVLLAFREAWLYSRGLHLQGRLQRSNAGLQSAREQLRRATDELIELERNTRFTARAGGVGLWDWDLRTQKVDYSPEWKRQLGYEKSELSDQVEEWRGRIHPEDAEAVLHSLERYLHRPSGEYQVEIRLRHRDGSYRWILASATAQLDRDGTPRRMLGAHVDITERKRMEMALRASEARHRELTAELERRVAERTADLEDAYREAQSFAYAVAHDLKAPLRAIDSFSHLLCESSAAKLNEVEKHYVGRVRRSAIHMASLIEGLLAYSRIEHREVSLANIEVRSVVDELIAERQEEIAARAVSVALTVPDTLRVRADREGLRVVLRNILDNALKFTATTAQPRIDIGARSGEDSAVLWIRDNGIGFDQSYHDTIFEIFHRLHRADEYQGTGIGLALARKATQRMRGRIWAESTPGVGATFNIELPVAELLATSC